MLCLNGDQWQMAAANSNVPPATDNWIQTMLTLTLFDNYFRTWFYPVRHVDPKNVYGKVESIQGLQDFKFNPLICAPKLWFRKEIILGNEV